MCDSYHLPCRCGRKSAEIFFGKMLLDQRSVTTLFCPECSDGHADDRPERVWDNGWILELDMEIIKNHAATFGIDAAELTAGWVFDGGYVTWAGIYPRRYRHPQQGTGRNPGPGQNRPAGLYTGHEGVGYQAGETLYRRRLAEDALVETIKPRPISFFGGCNRSTIERIGPFSLQGIASSPALHFHNDLVLRAISPPFIPQVVYEIHPLLYISILHLPFPVPAPRTG